MPSEDTKPVKAEEGDKKSLGSKKVSKATNTNAKPQSKIAKVKKEVQEADDSPRPIKAASSASHSKHAKVKKEENDGSDDDDGRPLAKGNYTINLDQEQKKKKKIRESAVEQKRREKKVYDLPGQKRDPPEEKDPLRIFYETLYKQVPNSEMAQLWMMESGLFPEEVAMQVHEKKQKKSLQQKFASPVKAVTAVKNSTESVTVKKKTSPTSTLKQSKKWKVEDESLKDDPYSDHDFIFPKAKKRKAA